MGRTTFYKKREKFPIRKGGRETGSTSLPKLLTSSLEGALGKINWEESGLPVNEEYLSLSRLSVSLSLENNCKNVSGPALRKLGRVGEYAGSIFRVCVFPS